MTETPDTRHQNAGYRIVIAGTGGQGVILSARLLTEFFVSSGHRVVSGQLHGMAQRRGAVQSTVMVDCGISPAMRLGGADGVVGLEPVETVRALPYVSAGSLVFMNVSPVVPFILSQEYVRDRGSGKYPDLATLENAIRAVTRSLLTLDATALAKQAGSTKTVNLVMLGCLFGSSSFPFAPDDFANWMTKSAPAKLVEANLRAFQSGVERGRDAHVAEEVP